MGAVTPAKVSTRQVEDGFVGIFIVPIKPISGEDWENARRVGTLHVDLIDAMGGREWLTRLVLEISKLVFAQLLEGSGLEDKFVVREQDVPEPN